VIQAEIVAWPTGAAIALFVEELDATKRFYKRLACL
jgi:hypothetical protein